MDKEQIQNYLTSILPSKGFKLYDLSLSRDGKALLIHLVVDRREYIDLDTISLLASELHEELVKLIPEEEEILLDCSSAGIEKNLSIEELGEYIEEYIYLSTHRAVNKLDYFYGYLKEVNDSNITVEINVSGRKKNIEVEKSNIAHIRLAIK